MLRRKAAADTKDTPVIALEDCLAKSRVKDGATLPGRTVEEHCRITGAVAKALMAALPSCTTRLFPENSDLVVAVHDVGKVSPCFQGMIHGVTGDASAFPALEPFRLMPGKLGHASVSQAALMEISLSVADIAGRHHGMPPEACSADDEICGGRPWQALRLELVRRLCDGRALPSGLSPEKKALLAGLTAASDWIGSGPLFDDPAEDWRPLAPRAVAEAGFRPVTFVPGLSFEDVFGFAPTAVQKTMAQAVAGPGVYVLEAPMGSGKTEAALFAAYRLLSTGAAGGLYFALPTRLTSNKIFERLLPFLHAVLTPESRDAAALLLHGGAWLYATHEDRGENASSWFEQSKRGLLAPFGAGTLDQALMSVINVRHAAVRSFGLAGKVVILDEVHSYDAYTGTLLDALIRHLERLGCTIILLSATLTRSRLSRMLGCEDAGGNAYPLITAVGRGEKTPEAPPAVRTFTVPGQNAPRSVHVRLCSGASENEAKEEALLRAGQGQQVLWIENSVPEAQEAFRFLAARASGMSIETGLLHSRFTPADRQKNEARWTALYGRNSAERSLCGRILVGTQVLEQSLDIDADFLVTRLCPTDMLFQRMGRLWRHEGTKRPAEALREALVLAPTPDEALSSPASAFGVSGLVYAPYVLARTLEVWNGRKNVTLPDDIRPMLEATYADRTDEPTSAMARAKRDLEQKVQSMRTLALFSRSEGGTLSDQAASTRLSDEPTCPVLIVRSLTETSCTLADGRTVSLARDASARRETSAALFSSIVRLRRKSVRLPQSVNASPRLRQLFLFHLPVRENYEPLYLARLREDGTLEDLCCPGGLCGRYSPREGWSKEDLPG